jgi:hypothetical protein
VDAESLRRAIIRTLKKQGYKLRNGLAYLPPDATKDDFRRVHELAVQRKLAVAEPGLRRLEDKLLAFIADGEEVDPHKVSPRLVYVRSDSREELLFRYASLHWSIPVSSGYGRRLRFLVMDESNGKLIGLFGLGDPVYALRARDDWIGWESEAKRNNLYHVMDAYVLGAVPPYAGLLCGKLVAMLALSNEVRRAFRRRYLNRTSRIRRKRRSPHLVLLTTTSALGRSSLYNRLRLEGRDYWGSVGFTQGYGEFQFSNGLYTDIRAFAERSCQPTARKSRWGTGFRSRREVIKKALPSLGLSSELRNHGIQRQIFVAPLGERALEYLRGERSRPYFYDWPAGELSRAFLKRWLIPRAERCAEWRGFRREEYRLWPKTDPAPILAAQEPDGACRA